VGLPCGIGFCENGESRKGDGAGVLASADYYKVAIAEPVKDALNAAGFDAVVGTNRNADLLVIVFDGFHFLNQEGLVSKSQASAEKGCLFPIFLIGKRELRKLTESPSEVQLDENGKQALLKFLDAKGYNATKRIEFPTLIEKVRARFKNTETEAEKKSPRSQVSFSSAAINESSSASTEAISILQSVFGAKNIAELQELCRREQFKGFAKHKTRSELEVFIRREVLKAKVGYNTSMTVKELVELARSLGLKANNRKGKRCFSRESKVWEAPKEVPKISKSPVKIEPMAPQTLQKTMSSSSSSPSRSISREVRSPRLPNAASPPQSSESGIGVATEGIVGARRSLKKFAWFLDEVERGVQMTGG